MIPNYGDKYDAEALLSPAQVVAEQGDGLPDVPPAIVLGYQADLTAAVRERADSRIEVVCSQHVYPLSETVGYVPVHERGIGAPVTATVAENVVAAGAEVVVLLGVVLDSNGISIRTRPSSPREPSATKASPTTTSPRRSR